MKKNIIYITISLFSLFSQLALAQISDDQQRQLKYWYYRERLRTRFMLNVGAGHGEGMPASFRRDYNSPGKIQWGADATIDLSYYIITLVTEYDLLSQNGQNTDATLNELFYALDALNRLDYYCDTWWGNGSGSLNGFLMRDDCCYDCWDASSNTLDNTKFQATITDLNNRSGGQINDIDAEWINAKVQNTPKHAASIDQYLHIYLALSVVIKKMNSFQGLPPNQPCSGQTFLDGNSYYMETAKDIMKRVINHIHNPGIMINTYWNWLIKDPAGVNVTAGPSAWLEAPALSKANYDLANHHNPSSSVKTFDKLWKKQNKVYKYLVSLPFIFHTGEGLKFLECMTFSGPGYINNFGLDYASKINLFSWSLNQKWVAVHMPLLNQYLHGTVDWHGNPYYRDLLDEAPCFGPYNFSDDCQDLQYQSYNWSSTTLLIHPERRGACGHNSGGNEPKLDFPGEYNGLDYMVIYNLVCLTKNEPLKKYFYDLYDNNMITDFPTSVNYGSTNDPANIISHNTITASNHISNTGDVEYRAGKSIDLTNNFTVDVGADFYAHIDDVECVGGGEEFERTMTTGILSPTATIKSKIQKEIVNFHASAFPIPFSDNFNINLNIDKPAEVKIVLRNIEGKLLRVLYMEDLKQENSFLTFSTENLERGFYLVTVEVGGESKSLKLIKTK
jgi:hypothetical protein